MKKILLLLALGSTCFISHGQKLKTENYRRSVLNIPVLPVGNFSSLNLTMYSGETGVTKEILHRYIGAMKIMMSGGERYSGVGFYTQSPVKLTNDRADINIELAFGTPEKKGVILKTGSCDNLIMDNAIENCKEYFYTVSYELPTAVQLTNKAGDVIDAWNYNSTMSLKFGNEAYQTESDGDGKNTIILYSNRYYDEASLAAGYQTKGDELLGRKSVLIRLSNVIDDVYQKAYYFYSMDKDKIAYGKGSFDYANLTVAKDEAIKLFESSKELEGLDKLQNTWKEELKSADYRDKKARISPKIAHGLYSNLALSYMYQSKYDSAMHYMKKVISSVPPKGAGTTSSSTSESPQQRADRLSRLIYFRNKAFDNNSEVEFNAETASSGINLKQQYGRRKFNGKYDFVSPLNRYSEIKENADEVEMDYQKVFNEMAQESGNMAAGGSKYRKMLQLQGLSDQLLSLNPFINKDIVAGAFPAAITSVTEITQLTAIGMKFTELPNTIGNLSIMKVLNLNNNNLTSIPESIGKCVSLKNLNLSNNNLTALPASIKNLVNLKSFTLKGNNFSADEIANIQKLLPAKCKLKL